MTISSNDAENLRRAGFTEYELDLLANAKTPDGKDQPAIKIDGPAWQSSLRSRRQWYDDRIANGWTEQQIINAVFSYYAADKKRTPFDFLKIEYRPRKRVDYYAIMGENKKLHVEEVLGEYPPRYAPRQIDRFNEGTRKAFRGLQEGLYGDEEE